jgi:serine protease
MRRIAAAAAATLLLATGVSAAVTQRYLVATKHPFRAGGAPAREARNVDGFGAAFDGYAADLTSDEAAALEADAGVRWVEPVIERHAFAQPSRNPAAQTVPYGVTLVKAPQVWTATHSKIINVVVIDTGIDYRHPELAKIYAGGYNFVGGNADPLDDAGHGTHVAGTIAASNDSAGVVGVAPDVRLWALKVLNASGSGTSESTIKAIDWVITRKNELGGNWVVNLSLGADRASNAEREAFRRTVAAGVLVVAASGNDSTASLIAPVAYPAAYEGVVSVGAIDDTLALASFSNQGPELDVVAPGVDVLSTLPLGTGSLAWIDDASNRYMGNGLEGAKRGSVTAPYVSCGLGKTGDFPASVAGKIALIKRGEITFAEKTRNAMAAGAIAVAIFNSDSSALSFTLWPTDDPTAKTTNWPVTIAIAKADGEALAARNSGTITVANVADDYGFYSGTSMASPHAAGAAALLWSTAPTATASEVAAALRATATDLGASGFDNAFGAGVVNVLAATQRLAPGAFTTIPPPPPTAPTTGRRILKRG